MIEELQNQLSLNKKVYFGHNAEFKFDLSKRNILLLTSSLINQDFLSKFISFYEKKGVNFTIEYKPKGEPYSDDINISFKKIKKKIDGIVGIGGGSVIDYAKALAILLANDGLINYYEFGERKINNILPLWIVPTTCGSGSEVTPYCVINNSESRRKYTLVHDLLKPIQAGVNPSLLKLVSSGVRLESGLDAFTHCLEALLNFRRDISIDLISEEGLRIAFQALPKLMSNIPSSNDLKNMSTLSLCGGISILHNRTGLIHTLSVAFSPYVSMSHGLLNAVLLKHALKGILPNFNGRLKEIISIMINKKIYSDEDALLQLSSWLESIIGNKKITSNFDLKNKKQDIIRRLIQDKGLEEVTYGGLDQKQLCNIVECIINEI